MNEFILLKLKPFSFIIVITICFLLELTFKSAKHQYKKRFITNTLLLVISSFLGTIIIKHQNVFIFENTLNIFSLNSLPDHFALIVTIVIFDFAIYWQHRVSHVIPFFWKIHRVHHSDKAMDISSAYRFHPLEIYLSSLYKGTIILLLSPKIEHYIIYETILFSFAIFNHSNFKITPKLESFLRLFIVTPQMHYPHHHPQKELTNSNYGNFLSIWDRVFNSYTKKVTHEFGLREINKDESSSLLFLLFKNFTNKS